MRGQWASAVNEGSVPLTVECSAASCFPESYSRTRTAPGVGEKVLVKSGILPSSRSLVQAPYW